MRAKMQHEQNATEPDNSRMKAIDAKIALLLVEKPAATDQELAEKIGVSRQTINRRKNGEAVQKFIRGTLEIPQEEIRRLAAKSLVRLEEMMDHEDPRIKLAASLALLKLTPDLISGKWLTF